MASFNSLPKLGDGTYSTLESDHLDLGPNKQVKVHHPADAVPEWQDLLVSQGSQHFFPAVADVEFNKMKDDKLGFPKKLDGSLRSSNNWYQVIVTTTAGDAVRTLAYHMSQGHVTTSGPEQRNQFKMLSWVPEVANIITAMGKGSCNSFQRGNSLTCFQVLRSKEYVFTKDELASLVVGNVTGDACEVFSRLTWNNGYAWTYQQPVNLHDLVHLPHDHCLHYMGQQALDYLAADRMTYIPPLLQVALNEYKATQGMATPARGLQDLNRRRGHPQHVEFLNTPDQPAGQQREEDQSEIMEPPARRARIE